MSKRTSDIDHVLDPSYNEENITDDVYQITFGKFKRPYFLAGLFIAFCFFMLFILAITVLFIKGVGIWGINIPVAWGFAIVNFVWWVGIGHAGTFISAILLLFRQNWRNSINRFSEAMTLFAVACAGLFPLLHLGRPWLFYWLLPYPDSMNLFPQYRSPLVWDAFAVMTYGLVSLLFWFVGMIPDLATYRDKANKKWQKYIFGLLSFGWRGSARDWSRFETTYLLLAGLATPLVISVHSIVSLDFSISKLPGWHSPIFPPYFVAGAIFSGFAMVLILIIPLRRFYRLQSLISKNHLSKCALLLLISSLVVGYSYAIEIFNGWYSADEFEWRVLKSRMFGEYAPLFWCMIFGNVILPQLFWWQSLRKNQGLLFVVSIVIVITMWLERYVIIVSTLNHDFLPSSWGHFQGTFWDWATLFGSVGFFFLLFLLFIRVFPISSIAEVKRLVHERKMEGAHEK